MAAKYKSLDDLVTKIQFNHLQLVNGKLDEEKLNDFIEEVQELHERLIIMRFKAFEDALEKQKENPKKEIELNLRNQISLIDAIEEEVKKESPDTEKVHFKIDTDSLNKSTKKEEPKEAPVIAEPILEKAEEPKAPIKAEQNETSINQRLADKQGTTLNDKLKKTPISDLPKAIGINQKYLFINELFNQNADHFHQVIQELNNCESYKQALTKVKGELVPNYDWDEENKHVLAFMDLVERRYLN